MKKDFDCVAMKRRAQTMIRAQVAGKSRKDEIAFFREGADEFQRRIDTARKSWVHRTRAKT